jgi:hypothetical protein
LSIIPIYDQTQGSGAVFSSYFADNSIVLLHNHHKWDKCYYQTSVFFFSFFGGRISQLGEFFFQKMKKGFSKVFLFFGNFGPFLEIKRIKLVTSTIQVPNPLR